MWGWGILTMSGYDPYPRYAWLVFLPLTRGVYPGYTGHGITESCSFHSHGVVRTPFIGALGGAVGLFTSAKRNAKRGTRPHGVSWWAVASMRHHVPHAITGASRPLLFCCLCRASARLFL